MNIRFPFEEANIENWSIQGWYFDQETRANGLNWLAFLTWSSFGGARYEKGEKHMPMFLYLTYRDGSSPTKDSIKSMEYRPEDRSFEIVAISNRRWRLPVDQMQSDNKGEYEDKVQKMHTTILR